MDKREKAYAKSRADAAADRALTIKKFICKGDPEIDCLRWYITHHPRLGHRIEGFSFGQNCMSMSMDCANDPLQYMPDKVREAALKILKSEYGQAN